MTKLKALLAAAAVLVAGGTTVTIALRQAGQQVGATCGEWAQLFERVSDPQAARQFYLAVQSGATIPKQAGSYLLGDCAASACTYLPQGCTTSYDYTYDCGPLRNGWRICTVNAHPYVARGWKQAAADSGGAIRWYGTKAEVVSACLAHFTGADCLAMLGGVSTGCWRLDTGDICRHGYIVRVNGPGDATPVACPAARVVGPFACTTNRGAGSEWQDAAETFSDAEMEAAP
jgi:hypothetical protein